MLLCIEIDYTIHRPHEAVRAANICSFADMLYQYRYVVYAGSGLCVVSEAQQ